MLLLLFRRLHRSLWSHLPMSHLDHRRCPLKVPTTAPMADQTVTICLHPQPIDGQWKIEVIDHGSGIEQNQLDVIFEPFFTTKERIAPPPQQKTNPMDDIKDLLKNRPWVILFGLAMIIMMTITLRAGSSYYYFTYYVEQPDLISLYLFWQMIAKCLLGLWS